MSSNSEETNNIKRIAVRVKRKAVAAIRQGHPWLFADSVERYSKDPAPGDVAILFDPDGKMLGAGLCDPKSVVRVRILAHKNGESPVGPELFAKLIHEAAERRAGKISADTTGWRLIHGESDGFSGLVADKYDDTLVLKIYSEAFIIHVPAIIEAIKKEYPVIKNTVIRLSRELSRCVTQYQDGDVIPPNAPVIKTFLENGIRFQADLKTGQKTGFFLDQRDNRQRVERLSANKDVLNVFCFSGGFSLYAARGGAKTVTGIDFDKHAIAACEKHFELNNNNPAIRRCRHTGICGDAFDAMRDLAHKRRLFDIVIVDPPSFAKSAGEKDTALKSYSALAKLAVKLLKKNGILVFASCSSRVTADDLFPEILRAAGDCLEVFDKTYHAADHPAAFAESAYLKCLWARKVR